MSFARTFKSVAAAGTLALAASFGAAQAQELKIGITIAATGPAAALGLPQKNTIAILPEKIGDIAIKIIQLDDGGDPTNATTNARRLITEDKVDLIFGSSTTPPSIAVGGVALELQTPHISLAPFPIQPGKEKYSVVMPQPVPLIGKALFEHMKKNGATTVGMIGFSDSWGDLWAKVFKDVAEPMGLKLIAEERFARADTSVTGQALKLVAAKPDVILVAASGTASALPQIALRERGFTGTIYQTHGSASKDLIRIAGKAAEGAIVASGPVMVAELQPETALTRKPGVAYVTAYEAKYGKDTRTQFGAHLWDAFQVLERIVPVAAKVAKPGTPEFKAALLAALESEKDIAAAHGVYNFTATNRYGVDDRARVLLTVKDGNFELVK